MTDQQEDPMIIEYCSFPNPELLERVVIAYLPFVRRVASRVNLSNPVLDQEDLVQCGTIGLIEALERFDPSKNVPFKAWAIKRVKGSILDTIRHINRYSKNRDVSVLDIDSDDGSLLEILYNDEDLIEKSMLRLDSSCSVILKDAILSLPVKQGFAILLSINGMKNGQIANILDVTPSAVHQGKQVAMKKLRGQLADKLKELM
jgi:RNA polymerase sigma factor (sigma-70 family)